MENIDYIYKSICWCKIRIVYYFQTILRAFIYYSISNFYVGRAGQFSFILKAKFSKALF